MTEKQAEDAGWLRFIEVTTFVPIGQKLYRSSAPNYRKVKGGDNDSSQKLTLDAVKFLTQKGIDSIISFNRYPYKPDEVDLLKKASIEYKHLSVLDFHSPIPQQLRDANTFFMGKTSTLVHCGFGHGRTGTGITGLQICTNFGQSLDPYASTWWGGRGNHVEKRQQMSVLSELRNGLLQNKSTGVPDVSPQNNFAIMNFATGYYLTLSRDTNTVVALSPETVEPHPLTNAKLWAIKKDKVPNNFTFSNCTTLKHFVSTEPHGAENEPVNNGNGVGKNTLFTITEATGDQHGLYIISPSPNPELVVAIKEPRNDRKRLWESKEMPAQLLTPSSEDEKKKLGLWILVPIVRERGRRY